MAYAIAINGQRVIAPVFEFAFQASKEAGHIGGPAVIFKVGEEEVSRLCALAADAYANPGKHFYSGEEYEAAAWRAS